MKRRFRIIAHRGASAYAPENTLLAFRRAIELGADMSELDVHLSQDGVAVVVHNYRVDETTNGHGEIQNLTAAQLQALDAGEGERVPTLQQVIDLVRGKNGLYLELKAKGTPQITVDLLLKNHFTGDDQAIVGSFQPDLVRQTKELVPLLSTALLVGPVYAPNELIAMAQDARADYIHLCWENRALHPHELVTPELTDALRAAGLGIVLWHEEREDELAILRTLDVDAICTNTPDKP